MKQYKIFINAQGECEAVKQGFSWPGFFFTFFWALAKKLWIIGIGGLCAIIVLGICAGAVGVGQAFESLIQAVSLVIQLIFGFAGNGLRESNLVSRGYKEVGTVEASEPEMAIEEYMKAAKSLPEVQVSNA